MPDRHPNSPQKIKARRGKGWCTAILVFLLMLGLLYALYFIREQNKQLLFMYNDRGECMQRRGTASICFPYPALWGCCPRAGDEPFSSLLHQCQLKLSTFESSAEQRITILKADLKKRDSEVSRLNRAVRPSAWPAMLLLLLCRRASTEAGGGGGGGGKQLRCLQHTTACLHCKALRVVNIEAPTVTNTLCRLSRMQRTRKSTRVTLLSE